MVKPVPIENGKQRAILVASSLSIFFAALCVGLRLVAKKMSSRFNYSDYFIVAALVCSKLYHLL